MDGVVAEKLGKSSCLVNCSIIKNTIMNGWSEIWLIDVGVLA